MKAIEVKQMKSLALAYVGDAVYELHIRNELVQKGQVKPNDLHQGAIKFVSGKAQASIILHWLMEDFLTDEEKSIVKRGRNAKANSVPKNLDIQTYRYSTGFEALIGYHYLLNHEERLAELLMKAVDFIREKEGKYA